MRLTLEEQETTINIMRTDDKASIYTSDKTMITKLEKLLNAKDSDWRLVKRYDDAITVEAPKDLISFRAKKVKINLTD